MTFFYITVGFNGLLPLWYPIITSDKLLNNKIQKVYIQNEPMVLYKKKNNEYILHTDICPHQRASFSKGWLNEFDNIHCPYHGFEFCDGMFCNIPNPSRNISKFKSTCKLQTYPIKDSGGILYTIPTLLNDTIFPELFIPPEETDSNFRSVLGHVTLKVPYQIVCENLLDMLHISYIHSFGNRYKPLPFSCKYEKLSSTSGRTTFKYHSNRMTISNKVGKVDNVIVENEFHLPTNTITRVFAGNIRKTVFTTCIPINNNETLLIWKIYRNFWRTDNDNLFSFINYIGDFIIDKLMQITIEEDKNILKNIYNYNFNYEPKIVICYDTTIRKFRKCYKDYLSNK